MPLGDLYFNFDQPRTLLWASFAVQYFLVFNRLIDGSDVFVVGAIFTIT